MQRKVTFVSLDLWPDIAPLVGAYLQGYACLEPEIRKDWQFEEYVDMPARLTAPRLLADLARTSADVYAFSCYAWNMGLVRAVVPALLEARPHTHIILGGPHVMHHATRYLDPSQENLVLCNGEGEKTFHNYLRQLSQPIVDLQAVKGLSFYRDGDLITTEPEDRIYDLDSIPSPYLTDHYPVGMYNHFFMETNRGCPYTCAYCYWGGAIGSKVHRFSEQRIKDEFTRLARQDIGTLFILDANWGIMERDVELTRHLVACKQQYGSPHTVGFCGAKNNARRVAQITKMFHDVNLLVSHSIAVQTMQDQALSMVGRKNISVENYLRLQRELNDHGISSHVELIWPLPGETLSSFKSGIGQMCAAGADSLYSFPLFLTNNSELNSRRDECGFITEKWHEVGSEAEIVVGTNEVSKDECLEGWRFLFAAMVVHNLRSLRCLSRYLADAGIERYDALFEKFSRFLGTREDLTISKLVEGGVDARNIDPHTLGPIAYYTDQNRVEFDSVLLAFVSSQGWWHEDEARLCFELDLLNRPFLLASVPRARMFPFSMVRVCGLTDDGYVVEIPCAFVETARRAIGGKARFGGPSVRVNQRQGQVKVSPGMEEEVKWLLCYQSAFTVAQIAPVWEDYGTCTGADV